MPQRPARPEQLVEEVAEPRLEHVEFGLSDRDVLGPIVCDGPRVKVVLGGRPMRGNGSGSM